MWAGHAIRAWIDVGQPVAKQVAAGESPMPLRPSSGGRIVLVAGPDSAVRSGREQEWPVITQLTIAESFNKPPEISLTLDFSRAMGRAFLATPALNLFNTLFVQVLQTGVAPAVRRQTRLYKGLLSQPPGVTSSSDGLSISVRASGVGLKSLQRYVSGAFPGLSRREILSKLHRDAGYEGIDFSAVDNLSIPTLGEELRVSSGAKALLDTKPKSIQAQKKGKPAQETSFYVEGGTRTLGAFLIAVASDAQCYLATGVSKDKDSAELLLVRPLEADAAVLSGQRMFTEEPGSVLPSSLATGLVYPMSNFQTSNGMYWLPGLAVDRNWKDLLPSTGEPASGTSARREAVTEDDPRDRRELESKSVASAPKTASFTVVEAASQTLSAAPQGLGIQASWESPAVPDLGLGEKVAVRTVSPRFDVPGGYLVTGFEHTVTDSDWTTKVEAAAFGMPSVSSDGPVPGRASAALTLTPATGRVVAPVAV